MALYGARVEYALHTLLNLSFAPTETAPSARDLAEFQKLPLPFISKLLTQLEKSQLVVGEEGIRGGWRLSRAPKDITVLDIVRATQGRQTLFDCQGIRARCALWPDGAAPKAARTGVCEIHAVMLAAEDVMRAELQSRTLADIASRVGAKAPRFVKHDVPGWFSARYHDRRRVPSK